MATNFILVLYKFGARDEQRITIHKTHQIRRVSEKKKLLFNYNFTASISIDF